VTFVAIWAIFGFSQRRGATPAFRSALLVTEFMVLLQGGLGAFLVVSGRLPREGLHFLYGVLAAVVIPVAAGYTSAAVRRREALIWMLAMLFMTGLVIRALTTA